MLKVSLMLTVAAMLTGCARFYERQEASFEQRLPQLVADCNEVFRAPIGPRAGTKG